MDSRIGNGRRNRSFNRWYRHVLQSPRSVHRVFRCWRSFRQKYLVRVVDTLKGKRNAYESQTKSYLS